MNLFIVRNNFNLPSKGFYFSLHSGKPIAVTSAENLELLKRTERTRYWKCLHDHSDILHHPYVNFMASCIYDPAVYLSNEEYQRKCPNRKQDIQTIVEKPYLYITGQSGSSDIDQLTYSDTRVEDLKEMHKCITATLMKHYFKMFFACSAD